MDLKIPDPHRYRVFRYFGRFLAGCIGMCVLGFIIAFKSDLSYVWSCVISASIVAIICAVGWRLQKVL